MDVGTIAESIFSTRIDIVCEEDTHVPHMFLTMCVPVCVQFLLAPEYDTLLFSLAANPISFSLYLFLSLCPLLLILSRSASLFLSPSHSPFLPTSVTYNVVIFTTRSCCNQAPGISTARRDSFECSSAAKSATAFIKFLSL